MPIDYYHATSFENALNILKTEFRPSTNRSLGNSIYFAESPESTLYKANCNKKKQLLFI